MKWLKRIILCSLFIIPSFVNAGSLSFNNPQKIASDKYSFTITAKDMDLNYLSGKLNITNGNITKITMSNDWNNKTGNNDIFYFYHNGIINGEYQIATVEVTMTGNSEYSASDILYGIYKCQKDKYGIYFDKNGSIVNETAYNNSCLLSTDARLESLTPSTGALSPSFSSDNYYYNLKLDSNVNSITFKAITKDKKAKVISGEKCDLTGTTTNCYIKVQSESNDIKTYTVLAYKEDCENNKIAISNFKVHNGVLDKKFSEDITNYTLIPDKNSENVYFSFDLDGINYTSKKCSSISSTCSLTITNNGTTKKYVFTIFHEEELESETATKEESNSSNNEQEKPPIKEENKKPASGSSENKENTEIKNEEESSNSVDQNENKEDEKTDNNNLNEEIKNTNKQNNQSDKNKFLIILSIVNVFLGICIGLFIKRKNR